MIYAYMKIQSVLGINNKNFLINCPFDLRKYVDSILWSSKVKADHRLRNLRQISKLVLNPRVLKGQDDHRSTIIQAVK
jgi:hypothetical protein